MNDLQNQIASARAFFSEMPAFVFESWLVEFIEHRGWPPTDRRWPRLFRGFSPEQWQNFSWELRTINLASLKWHPDDKNMLRGLRDARFRGFRNLYTDLENSQPRAERIMSHLVETGGLPGHLILLSHDSWRVIDGSHRIAVFQEMLHFLPSLQDFECLAWVARPAAEVAA